MIRIINFIWNFMLHVPPIIYKVPPKPPRESGFDWVWIDGAWNEVCDFCGGNCGQCGLTGRLGCRMPASMDRMASNLGKGR